jgi:hypothetical protein
LGEDEEEKRAIDDAVEILDEKEKNGRRKLSSTGSLDDIH